VTSGLFQRNVAAVSGGAIFVQSGGVLNVTQEAVAFRGNSAPTDPDIA